MLPRVDGVGARERAAIGLCESAPAAPAREVGEVGESKQCGGNDCGPKIDST